MSKLLALWAAVMAICLIFAVGAEARRYCKPVSALLCGVTLAGCGPCQPVGPATGWTPVWKDDFNGPAGSKPDPKDWTTSWFGGATMNGVKTDPANVYEDGHGNLVLRLSSLTVGATADTNPSDAGTVGHYGHGHTIGVPAYVEARLWLPGNHAGALFDWPTFWTNGQQHLAAGEVDVLEGLGAATSNYHARCPTDPLRDCQLNSGTIAGDWSGWHTYGLDREPGMNYIYWDGKLVFSYKTTDDGGPEYIVLSMGNWPTAQDRPGDVFKVDYVKEWSK